MYLPCLTPTIMVFVLNITAEGVTSAQDRIWRALGFSAALYPVLPSVKNHNYLACIINTCLSQSRHTHLLGLQYYPAQDE